MKNIALFLVIIMSTFLSFSDLQAQKEIDKVSVVVEGLGCPFCAFGLEKKLKEVDNIKKIEIDMETGMTTFRVPSSNMMTIEQVSEKVDEAGYTPISVKIERSGGQIEETGDDLENKAPVTANAEGNFYVNGNCDMCKSRIERTANLLPGIATANWDKETKILSFTYDDTQVSPETLSEAIAKVGYDTEMHKSTSEDYEKLPMCCKYERSEE